MIGAFAERPRCGDAVLRQNVLRDQPHGHCDHSSIVRETNAQNEIGYDVDGQYEIGEGTEKRASDTKRCFRIKSAIVGGNKILRRRESD